MCVKRAYISVRVRNLSSGTIVAVVIDQDLSGDREFTNLKT